MTWTFLRRLTAPRTPSAAVPMEATAPLAPTGSVPPAPERPPPQVDAPALRWTEGPVNCLDLVDRDGRVRGYVGPSPRGVRGYRVQSRSEWPPRPPAYADHATQEAARAWVEAGIGGRVRGAGR